MAVANRAHIWNRRRKLSFACIAISSCKVASVHRDRRSNSRSTKLTLPFRFYLCNYQLHHLLQFLRLSSPFNSLQFHSVDLIALNMASSLDSTALDLSKLGINEDFASSVPNLRKNLHLLSPEQVCMLIR